MGQFWRTPRGKPIFGSPNKAVNTVIGGWSLNGIYTFQSGEPFTVRFGFLTANNVGQSRAALVPGVAGPVFFPGASMFANPGPGQPGHGDCEGIPDVGAGALLPGRPQSTRTCLRKHVA